MFRKKKRKRYETGTKNIRIKGKIRKKKKARVLKIFTSLTNVRKEFLYLVLVFNVFKAKTINGKMYESWFIILLFSIIFL